MFQSDEEKEKVVGERLSSTLPCIVMVALMAICCVVFIISGLRPVLHFWMGLGVAYLLCHFLPKRWSSE